MANLFLASNKVSVTPFGHLQLVNIDGETLTELEVQPSGLASGNWVASPAQPHNQSDFAESDYGRTEISVGPGRSVDDVWTVLQNARASLAQLTITYHVGASLGMGGWTETGPAQNSNSYITTLLHVVGLDVEDFLGAATPSTVTGHPGVARNVLFEFLDADGNAASPIGLNLDGSNGHDILQGGNAVDNLNGRDGNDTMRGFGGDDVLYGGENDDNLSGMDGNDSLYGDNGSDVLAGGSGTNALYGGSGIDTAVFAGNRADYAPSTQTDGSIRLERTNLPVSIPETEVHTTYSIERFQFADGITDQFLNPISGGIALISGLGGDAGFGENILGRNDDGSSAAVDITSVFENGLNFFGRVFTQLWVNNNGSVTFNGPRGTFTPSVITENSGNPEITPFFADVYTSSGPASVSPGGNSTGSNLVYWDLDPVSNRFIATWDDVGYYTSNSLTNAFQLILTDVGNGDFDIEFRYENVTWTTGNASGGSGGLGGSVARAGYTAGTGNPDAYFELPASGDQAAILALDSTLGNTGQIGRWVFPVRSGDIDTAGIPPLPPIVTGGRTSGDPHLMTLDGVGYSFHAAGEYVLMRATDDSGFEVQARMVPIGNGVSVNAAVATRLDGGRVQIDGTDAQPVSVNGTVVTIEDFGSLDVGTDRIFREGDRYTIVYAGADGVVNAGDSRLIVTVRDGRVDVDVRLNSSLNGRLEGLLGNADGNPDNDIALANGTPLARPLTHAELYGQYRDDWRVTTAAQSLFTYDTGETLAGFYRADYPAAILSLSNFDPADVAAASAVVQAAGLIPGTLNFENAVLDYMLTRDTSFIDSAANVPIVGSAASAPVVASDGQVRFGTDGPDRLIGGDGSDTLSGGGGADYLDGGAGANVLRGGLANDRYVIRSTGDVIEDEIGFSQGGGIDTVESWISYTLPRNVEILRLQGAANLDGAGGAAPEALVGNTGANTLRGNGGNDVLNGKSGNDTLIGGAGADSLVGEDGADVFVFLSAADSRPGQTDRDFINGFERGIDRIDLSAIDANPVTAGDQAFSFIGTAAFSGAAGELRYQGYGLNWVIVSADADGDRTADMQVFVNLVTALDAADFVL
jgi:Ca2+-binding RTX toxin-like protein